MTRGTHQPDLRSVFAEPAYRRLWGVRTVSQRGDTFRFAVAVVVNRLPRLPALIASDVVRAAQAGVLALWHGHPLTVYAVAFGTSAG